MSGGNAKSSEGEIIPFGVLLVGLILGGALLFNQPLTGETAWINWILIILCGLGVLYVGVGFRGVYEEDGLHQAVNWLFNGSLETNSVSGSSTTDTTEKTPPAPEKLKNKLYFERANQQCEWCGERIDTPEVHHIQPRSEGGPNTRKNLIVLCPNCHRKADGGTIGRSKLKYRVREQMEEWEE